MKKLIVSLFAVITCLFAMTLTVSADEWVKTDKGYVYEYDNGTTAEKGWLTIGKDKYYIQKDGTRKTGWLKTTSSKYYFGKDGKMYKSRWLIFKDGTKYYLRSNGKVAVDCSLKISEKTYSFDKQGKLIATIQEGDVLYNKNNITITYKGLFVEDTKYGDTYLKFEIENQNDKKYMVQISDLIIDGYTITPSFHCDVLAGTKCIDEAELEHSTYTLRENGVEPTEIKQISFKFIIFYDYKIKNAVYSDTIYLNY